MEQFTLFNRIEISHPQQQVFQELQSVINAELNKHLTKMVESTVNFCNNRIGPWKNHIEYLERRLNEADKLLTGGEEIMNLNQIEINDLQRQLNKYSTKIENQRKTLVDQQCALINKSKQIEKLEANYQAVVLSLKEQNNKILTQEEDLKVYTKTTTDLTLEIAELRRQNDHWISEIRRISDEQVRTKQNYEERLSDQGKMKDQYYSAYLLEIKKNDSLHIEAQKQATVHQSQLYDRAKEIERLKNEKTIIKSELEQVKLQPKETEVPAASNDLNIRKYKLILDEKESKIQEYLKIINEKDAKIWLQKLCCPVCLTDLDENEEMLVFYACGHRACSKCFDDFPETNLAGTPHKQCPICKAGIIRSVVLADT